MASKIKGSDPLQLPVVQRGETLPVLQGFTKLLDVLTDLKAGLLPECYKQRECLIFNIGCRTLPQVLEHLQPGVKAYFDDKLRWVTASHSHELHHLFTLILTFQSPLLQL